MGITAKPYGDGLYANEPPTGYGLNIEELFHIVKPKKEDPGINSAVDSKYPNVAIITFDKTNQFGGMWAKEKLDLTLPFYTKMYLHLGHQYDINSRIADGMTFTLHNDPDGLDAIGGAGEGIGVYKGRKWSGFGWETNPHGTFLKHSLVIEFDTYRNKREDSAFVDDPVKAKDAHCSLLIPRTNSISTSDHRNTHYFTPSQRWVEFEVKWMPNNSGGGTLEYSFDNIEREHTIDNIITTFGKTKVYWGFTGATGQLTSVQAAAIVELPEQDAIAGKTVKNEAGEDINQGITFPGDTISYTIRGTSNQLFKPNAPIIINDEISEYVEFVDEYVKVTTGAGSVNEIRPVFCGSTMIISTGQYLAEEGDWIEVTFNVKVKDTTTRGKIIYNRAIINVRDLPGSQETNTTEVTISERYEKMVSNESKAGQRGSAVKTGDEITYNISYGNNGSTSAKITITDRLADGVKFKSASDDGRYDRATKTVTWIIKNVDGGTGGFVSVVVSVNETAVVKVENYAVVQVEDNKPQVTNTVVNPVNPENLRKIVSASSKAGQGGVAVKKGDRITYDITYLNYQGTAANIVITDKLSVGMNFVSVSDRGIYDEATRTVTWTLADVPSGEEGIVSLVSRVNESAQVRIENYATVRVEDNEPLPTNNVVNPLIRLSDPSMSRACRKTITGRKLWVDDNNASDTRPTSVIIVLLRDGKIYRKKTIDSTGDGNYIFACLPVWKNSEEAYNYKVDELEVPANYTKTIEGYSIINTLTTFNS